MLSCALYTGQCPTQGITLEVSLPPYIPSSHAPPLPLSLAPLLPPSSARFLPPFPSLRQFLRSFLTHSLPQPSLPSSAPAPTLVSSSLPPCSLPPHPPLSPTLPSSTLHRSFPASLHACLSSAVQFNGYRMCVWQAALYCVAPSHA